jgi:hypothetical protein
MALMSVCLPFLTEPPSCRLARDPQIQILDSGTGLQSCAVQYSTLVLESLLWALYLPSSGASLSLITSHALTPVTLADGNNEGFQKRTPQPAARLSPSGLQPRIVV